MVNPSPLRAARLPYIGYPRTLNALRVIDEVVPPVNTTNADDSGHE